MCSPSSSFDVSHNHHHRLRKGVPDGSEDFQRVLDTIHSNDTEKDEIELEINREAEKDNCKYEDDFEYYEDSDDRHSLGNAIRKTYCDPLHPRDNGHLNSSISDSDDENNNSCDKHSCKVRQCKKLERNSVRDSPVPLSGLVSPSEINIFDSDGILLYHCDSDADDPLSGRDPLRVRFPSINQHLTQASQLQTSSDDIAMGANCSSGLYDQRDWHDIISKEDLSDTKVRKKGKPLSKKQLNLNPTKENGVVSSQLCTCKYRISDSSPDPVSEPIPIPGADILDANGHDTGATEKGNGFSPKSGSPNFSEKQTTPTRSNNQNRLSRILGVKKTASPSKTDVSPHRLLVRRSYSPKSRASSMEEMIRQNNDSVYRQRSQSWSNGKLGSKPAVKTNTTPLIQSPVLLPVANHTALVPSRFISNNSPNSASDKVKDKLLPDLTQGQLISNSAHDQSCPLFKVSQQKDRLSPRDLPDDDDDITPMTRRRTVSESQTLRARQKARRAAAMQNGQDSDHLHVHWADEGEGSPLSTSVFLSSIRPRSFSHSAVGSEPQRPILKKVFVS